MFPHVQPQDGRLAFHDRAVLIGRGIDFEIARTVPGEPGPAGTEARRARGRELLLHGVETAEGTVDRRGQVARGVSAAAAAHDRPELRVVGVAAAVVAHGGLDRVRHDGAVVRQQFVQALAGQVAVVRQGVVQVGDIGVVVLAVMDFHGTRVDVGLERVMGIGQIGQRE